MGYFHFKFKNQKFFVQNANDIKTLFFVNEHESDMLLFYLKSTKIATLIHL